MAKLTVATTPAVRRLLLPTMFVLSLAAVSAPALADLQPPPADPVNLPAVEKVCGRCHGVDTFSSQPRAWPRWLEVFTQMKGEGASGSEADMEKVTAYFLDHLSIVNVNTSSEGELAWVLDLTDEQAADMAKMRVKTPFKTLADVAKVPGVKQERLDMLKPRIEF